MDSFLCHKSTIFLWALLLCKGLFCEFAMVIDGYALKKDEVNASILMKIVSHRVQDAVESFCLPSLI